VTERPVGHHDGANTVAELRTWHTVNSGFFRPPRVMCGGENRIS
jgi:hypothetical protein